MLRSPFVMFVVVGLASLVGPSALPALAWEFQAGELPVEPPPPTVTVAGSRLSFTRDLTGRVNVHFNEGFHPDHVEVLQKHKPVGTVFFSGRNSSNNEPDLRLLCNVQMSGLALIEVGVTDENLEALKGHSSIESVWLSNTRVTDKGLDVFKTLPKLVSIMITSRDITDIGLAKIAELKSLTSVGVNGCPKITDDGVARLPGIQSLRFLALSTNEKLTRNIVKSICTFKDLDQLELGQLQLTSNDMADLAHLTKLEKLDLYKLGIDDEGAKHISHLGSLKSLGIAENGIGDVGVAHLNKLTKLKRLVLSKNPVTDQGITKLTDLQDLERLELASTKVTDQGVKSLSNLGKLSFLLLNDTLVTGKCIESLDHMKQLKSVALFGTAVLDRDLTGFRERNPMVKVFPTPGFALSRKVGDQPKALPTTMLKPQKMIESKPVTVNGVEFVAVVSAEWVVSEPLPPPAPPPPNLNLPPLPRMLVSKERVDIQLRLINRTNKDLILPLDNTFSLTLMTTDGKEVRGVRVRVREMAIRPVLVRAGGSYCLSRNAFLLWNKDRDTLHLTYELGENNSVMFSKLHAGTFSLSFQFANNKKPAEGPNEIDGVSIWTGTTVTPEIQFRIIVPPALVGRR